MSDTLSQNEKEEVLNKNVVIKLKVIAQMVNLIDVASSRGAFKGNEMTFVGSLYDSLNKGLEQNFKKYIDEKLKTIKEEEEVNNIKDE